MKALGHVLSILTFLVTVSWWFAAVGLAVSLCLIGVSLFVPLSGMRLTVPVSFSVDPEIIRVAPSSPGAKAGSGQNIRVGSDSFGFEVGGERNRDREPRLHVRGSLRFPTESRAIFAGTAALLFGLLTFVMWVLDQIRGVFRTLRDGRPFVPANAARIRRIAFAVILGEVARAAIVLFENYYAMTHFAAEGLRFDARPDFNFLAIFYGLIILAIAEVFQAGTRLDEEQSLTV